MREHRTLRVASGAGRVLNVDRVLGREFLRNFVEPGRRLKHISDKYVNETPVRVEVLDSTWYTNIIRTEGFDVSGFFRLQRVGSGRCDQKLVYVHPFRKHGYKRQARKHS